MKNYIIKTTTGEYVLTLSVNEKNVDIFLIKMMEQVFDNIPKSIAFRNVYVHRNVNKNFECIYNETKDCVNHCGIWLNKNEESFKEWINNILSV